MSNTVAIHALESYEVIRGILVRERSSRFENQFQKYQLIQKETFLAYIYIFNVYHAKGVIILKSSQIYTCQIRNIQSCH